MTCHHAKGDPACGAYARESASRETEKAQLRAEIAEEDNRRLKEALASPDSEKFAITKAVEIKDRHLVLEVTYPNCEKCSYEGRKVMVFLNVRALSALHWKKIDPHFREKSDGREAPGPSARFPASERGWNHALRWAEEQP